MSELSTSIPRTRLPADAATWSDRIEQGGGKFAFTLFGSALGAKDGELRWG